MYVTLRFVLYLLCADILGCVLEHVCNLFGFYGTMVGLVSYIHLFCYAICKTISGSLLIVIYLWWLPLIGIIFLLWLLIILLTITHLRFLCVCYFLSVWGLIIIPVGRWWLPIRLPIIIPIILTVWWLTIWSLLLGWISWLYIGWLIK